MDKVHDFRDQMFYSEMPVERHLVRAVPATAPGHAEFDRQADEASGVMEPYTGGALTSDDRRVKLVRDVAAALSRYFDNHLADCHAQAVRMLVKAGPLRGHAVGDFTISSDRRRSAKGSKIQ
jgi:hypothetical protein